MRKDAFVWYQKMPSHHLSSVKEPKLYILNLLIQKLLTTTKLIHTFFKGYSTGSWLPSSGQDNPNQNYIR